MVGSIEVVGALALCALHHSVCEMKTAQKNVQRNLIRELTLYKFELGHNADAEATKETLPWLQEPW